MEEDLLPESSRKELEQHSEKVTAFELARRMKQTVVPTDDSKVRLLLRQMGEPITLFGEREAERRDRLRKLLAQQDTGQGDATGQIVLQEQQKIRNELFYTEGTGLLLAAREKIAQYSLKQAAQRFQAVKRRRGDPELALGHKTDVTGVLQEVKGLSQQSSEVADDRPISSCQFSPDGQLVAVCGWGGIVSTWNAYQSTKRWSARAHEERCTDVAWHPQSCLSQSPDAVNLATGCADASGALLSMDGKVLRRLVGHTDRLARIAFHPMGMHLATASYDMTWRLWDIETGFSLLEQEGHSRSVYAVTFHPDGSLVVSAGLDAIGRGWDCRSGKSVLTLEGHIKQILALDVSRNGHHVVSGSDDHTCKIWDLRTRRCLYTIAGHRSLVTSVRYERDSGAFLASASFDSLIKVWSGRSFECLKTLAGHEGKVMAVDVAPDGSNMLASVSYDRSLKIWAPESI